MTKQLLGIFRYRNLDEQNWREKAACKGKDTSEFYLEDGKRLTSKIKQMCYSCPVRIDCLHYAIKNAETYGIWGGLGHRSRLEYARQNNIFAEPNTHFSYYIEVAE